MFFSKEAGKKEIVKWGIYSGTIEAVYVMMLALLYFRRDAITAIAQGWEKGAAYATLLLFSLSLITITLIVISYPIYFLVQKRYYDFLLTLLITIATFFVLLLLVIWLATISI